MKMPQLFVLAIGVAVALVGTAHAAPSIEANGGSINLMTEGDGDVTMQIGNGALVSLVSPPSPHRGPRAKPTPV